MTSFSALFDNFRVASFAKIYLPTSCCERRSRQFSENWHGAWQLHLPLFSHFDRPIIKMEAIRKLPKRCHKIDTNKLCPSDDGMMHSTVCKMFFFFFGRQIISEACDPCSETGDSFTARITYFSHVSSLVPIYSFLMYSLHCNKHTLLHATSVLKLAPQQCCNIFVLFYFRWMRLCLETVTQTSSRLCWWVSRNIKKFKIDEQGLFSPIN